MTRRARHRLQTSLFAILCLVFQQAAVAAYLCPVQQMPAQMEAMADHCAGMGMEQAKANPALCDKHCNPDHQLATDTAQLRSEEHTSELQSLMRISNAVFCLKN